MTFDRPVFLHVDMDAFFASVEQRDHPEWRGKPVVVGSPPDQRGVVSAASYEARTFGIHSAMPSRTAYKKCPTAIFCRVNMKRYQEVSAQIMEIFDSFTPWVRPLSIDEAFLDVTGSQRLFGDGPTIANKIRAAIKEKTQLTASVGVAPNLFLAKIASDMNKPDGVTVVPFDKDAIPSFLSELPIGRMWGIGKVTKGKLLALGISTFGDLQAFPITPLEQAMGKHAAHQFNQLAWGIDTRGMEHEVKDKSISNESTFSVDTNDRAKVEAAYKRLIDQVSRRLRKAKLFTQTVHLKLRWDDFSTITRQTTLSLPVCDDTTLREAGMMLFNQNMGARSVRLIGFSVSHLSQSPLSSSQQLDLFAPDDSFKYASRQRLSQTADVIREKYGEKSIFRAATLSSGDEDCSNIK